MAQAVRIGVIGLGFMGATHIAAYQSAKAAGLPCELVAVADPKVSRRAGNLSDVGGNLNTESRETRAFDANQVKGYERADDLLSDPHVDLVSICTRTDTHVEVALKALQKGKHILIEKPVALRSDQIQRLIDAAQKANRICMPAMCMRFWPGWPWLKQAIDENRFGRCVSATFQRLAPVPAWSTHFFSDPAKSGGSLFDLHIHDADFVRWCFGDPQAITSAGHERGGGVDHVTTLYHYQDGPRHVVAEAGSDHAPGFAFRMRYIAIFENATADFDMAREQQLLLIRNGQSEPIPLDSLSGYDGEVRAIVSAVAGQKHPTLPTLEEAKAVIDLLTAEEQSVLLRKTVVLTSS